MIYATTPSQTVGPYFAIGLPWPEGPHAIAPEHPDAIRISGTAYDGAGAPIADTLLEIWGADPDGRYADLWGHGGAGDAGLPRLRALWRGGWRWSSSSSSR